LWESPGRFAFCREGVKRSKGDEMTLQPALPITDYAPTYRNTAIQALAQFRREWEEIAAGESLMDVTASIGLLLSDVADRLELTPQERYVFLGKLLMEEIEEFMLQQVSLVKQ